MRKNTQSTCLPCQPLCQACHHRQTLNWTGHPRLMTGVGQLQGEHPVSRCMGNLSLETYHRCLNRLLAQSSLRLKGMDNGWDEGSNSSNVGIMVQAYKRNPCKFITLLWPFGDIKIWWDTCKKDWGIFLFCLSNYFFVPMIGPIVFQAVLFRADDPPYCFLGIN